MADLELKIDLKGVDSGLKKSLKDIESSLMRIADVSKTIDFGGISNAIKSQTSVIKSSIASASGEVSKLDANLEKLRAKTLTLNPKNGTKLFEGAVDKFTTPGNIIGSAYANSQVEGLKVLVQATKSAATEEQKIEEAVTKHFIEENNKKLAHYKNFLAESKKFAEQGAKETFKIKQDETKRIEKIVSDSNKRVVEQVQRLGNTSNIFTKKGNSTLSDMSKFYNQQAKEAIVATKELEGAQSGLLKGFKEGLTSGALGRGFVSGAGFAAGLAAIRAGIGVVKDIGGQFVQAEEKARSFDKSLREIKSLGTIVDEAELKRVGDLIGDIATKYGTDLKQQTEAFYTTVSNGIRDTAKATEVINAANKLATAGVGDVNKATILLTDALNVINGKYKEYGLETITASKAADILFNGVNFGKIRIDELTSSLGKILPIGNKLGISLEEMTAALAGLTTQGLTTRERTIQLQGVFNQLIKQQDKLPKGLELTQIKVLGLAEYMTRLEKATKGNVEELADIFTNIRALQGVIGLTGTGLEKFIDIQKQMAKSTNASSVAAEELQRSLQFDVDAIVASYDRLQAESGKSFSRFFTGLKKEYYATLAALQGFGDQFKKSLDKSLTSDELVSKIEELTNIRKSLIRGDGLTATDKGLSDLDKRIAALKSQLEVKKIETQGDPDKLAREAAFRGLPSAGDVRNALILKARESSDKEAIDNIKRQIDLEIAAAKILESKEAFSRSILGQDKEALKIRKEILGSGVLTSTGQPETTLPSSVLTRPFEEDIKVKSKALIDLENQSKALQERSNQLNPIIQKEKEALDKAALAFTEGEGAASGAGATKAAKSSAETYIESLQKELGKQAKFIDQDKVSSILFDKLGIQSNNNLAVSQISSIISAIKSALAAGLKSPSLEGQVTYLEKLIGTDKASEEKVKTKVGNLKLLLIETFKGLPENYNAEKGNALIDQIISDDTIVNKLDLLRQVKQALFEIRQAVAASGDTELANKVTQGIDKVRQKLPDSPRDRRNQDQILQFNSLRDSANANLKDMTSLANITKSVSDSFADATLNVSEFGRTLGASLRSAANDILSTIIRVNLLKAAFALVGGGASKGTGTAFDISSTSGSLLPTAIEATGGEVTGLGSGTSDSNIVALSSGEAVLTARSTKMLKKTLGSDVINKLNRLGGGDFGAISILSSLGNLSGNLANIGSYASGGEIQNTSFQGSSSPSVKIINNTSTPIQQDNIVTKKTLEGIVTEIIISDQKSNGSINRSMKSNYGLSQRGVF